MMQIPASAQSVEPRPRDLRLYLSVRFSTTLGTQIQSVAVGWQIYDMTRDPVALGYVGLCIFLPMLLLERVGGLPPVLALPVVAVVLIASALGFAAADAKTADHFFTGKLAELEAALKEIL